MRVRANQLKHVKLVYGPVERISPAEERKMFFNSWAARAAVNPERLRKLGGYARICRCIVPSCPGFRMRFRGKTDEESWEAIRATRKG